jgi:urea carboxylase-associated protein 2
MGRLFAVLENDTCGWHDTACGCGDAALVAARYGGLSYQEARNDFHRNARDCFLIELAKWGLGKRDLVPNLNLFSKVTADDDGKLAFVPGHSRPGATVELHFAMDTLVVLNTCRHPLDPSPVYTPNPVLLEVLATPPLDAGHPSFAFRAENRRAWENTEPHYLLNSS